MYLYLIQSKKDYSFYIGVTDNLRRRISPDRRSLRSRTISLRAALSAERAGSYRNFAYLVQPFSPKGKGLSEFQFIEIPIREHNKGLSRVTKYKIPWVLIYCEWYRSRKDAIKREYQLKKHKSGWIRIKERIKNSILPEQN